MQLKIIRSYAEDYNQADLVLRNVAASGNIGAGDLIF